MGTLPLLVLPLTHLASARVLWLVPPVLLAATLLAVTMAKPVEELRDTAGRLQAGDLKARAMTRPGSDWATIAGALGVLADRLDLVTRNFEQEVYQRTAALTRKADQLKAVGQVGQQVAAVLEPEALLHFVVRVMRGTFGYELVAALRRHGDHLVMMACAARGHDEVPLGRAFPVAGPGAPPLAQCMQGDGTVGAAATHLVDQIAASSELAVPLRLGDHILGVLAIQSLQPDAFDADDLFTVRTIAGQVAVALENARLFAAERQLRDLAIAEERNRMAREIHDTLAQGFMGIIMQLRAMRGASDPETARFHREQAEQLAAESLQEARRSVWNLRPHPLESGGLAGALAAEAEALQRRTNLSVRCGVEGDPSQLSPSVEAALLRILQEALHNTVKHGNATRAAVRLAIADGFAELTVEDDGRGFDPAALHSPARMTGSGLGLMGMAERARESGGALRIESAPGTGCRVTARVPCRSNP